MHLVLYYPVPCSAQSSGVGLNSSSLTVPCQNSQYQPVTVVRDACVASSDFVEVALAFL